MAQKIDGTTSWHVDAGADISGVAQGIAAQPWFIGITRDVTEVVERRAAAYHPSGTWGSAIARLIVLVFRSPVGARVALVVGSQQLSGLTRGAGRASCARKTKH